MTVPVIRERTWKPKARTGCRTCKVRRIKCDEQRPVCWKCSSTGRTCNGFELPVPRQDNGPFIIQPLVPKPSSAIIPQPSVSLNLSISQSQAFQFFCQQSTREMPGYFRSTLWDHLILQICRQEPSVLHAAIAVGSIHRYYKERGNASQVGGLNEFGLKHYGTAIGHLRSRIGGKEQSQSAEIALLSCLLFIAVEMLQGQRVQAHEHLCKGLQILSSLPTWVDGSLKRTQKVVSMGNAPHSLIGHLISVFVRLDYESISFGVKMPQLCIAPRNAESGPNLGLPGSFSSLLEARWHMDNIANASSRFSGEMLQISESINGHKDMDWADSLCWDFATINKVNIQSHPNLHKDLKELEGGLAVWPAALEALKNDKSKNFSNSDIKGFLVLELQYFFYLVFVSTWHWTRELDYDAFNEQFQHIINLAETYITMESSEGTGKSALHFTLEPGISKTIYLVAFKCREPRIRRDAIAVLFRSQWQEGMWDGKLIGRFIEKCADLEEARACCPGGVVSSRDIPEAARFKYVVLSASEDPFYARLVCARYRHETDGAMSLHNETWRLV